MRNPPPKSALQNLPKHRFAAPRLRGGAGHYVSERRISSHDLTLGPIA
jgi:hypothetical protein